MREALVTAVGAQSKLSLREVTAATVRTIIGLEVGPSQSSYVATNAVSLAEAQFNPGSWFRAIYADDRAVGFVLLFDPLARGAMERAQVERDDVVLWRFMIDARYQRLGFGRRALDLVCAHVRECGQAARLLTSYFEGPEGPEAFYRAYGFEKTGRWRAGGTEVEIALPMGPRSVNAS